MKPLPSWGQFAAACACGLSVIRPVMEAARKDDTFGWNFGAGWPPSYQAYGRLRALLTLDQALALKPLERSTQRPETLL